jgi:hypothetical protein
MRAFFELVSRMIDTVTVPITRISNGWRQTNSWICSCFESSGRGRGPSLRRTLKKSKLKGRAGPVVRYSPEPAAVTFNDGTAD